MSSVQTMKTWAREIKYQEDLPRAFTDTFHSFVRQDAEFPYTVFSPPYRNKRGRSDACLLFTQDNKIFILRNVKGKISTVIYPFQSIDYIEHGTILLTSWIKLEGLTTDNQTTTTIIEFNTVIDSLFLKFISIIRSTFISADSEDQPDEKSKLNYLRAVNFKFMNYAKQSIMPGETISNSLFQSAILQPRLKILSKTLFRQLSPSHLHILTDQELILVCDPESQKLADYGGIWIYIPIGRIRSRSRFYDKSKGLYVLQIQLLGGKEILSYFEESNEDHMKGFYQEIN